VDALFGNGLTAQMDRLLEELWKTPGWPRDEERDRALIGELIDQFPRLDLEDQFGAFRLWIQTKGTGQEVKTRGRWARVRNWCKKAGQPGRTVGGKGPGGRRTSTAARPVEAFGDSSQSLARW
jgi:hypothetical protein